MVASSFLVEFFIRVESLDSVARRLRRLENSCRGGQLPARGRLQHRGTVEIVAAAGIPNPNFSLCKASRFVVRTVYHLPDILSTIYYILSSKKAVKKDCALPYRQRLWYHRGKVYTLFRKGCPAYERRFSACGCGSPGLRVADVPYNKAEILAAMQRQRTKASSCSACRSFA